MNREAQTVLQFQKTREFTKEICEPLEVEDYVPQPIVDVSPPKWHLACICRLN